MKDDYREVIELVRRSLDEQISAAREDSIKAIGESGAALEISAELEKRINEATSENEDLRKILQEIREELNSNKFLTSKNWAKQAIGDFQLGSSMQLLIVMAAIGKDNRQPATLLHEMGVLSHKARSKIDKAKNEDEIITLFSEFMDDFSPLYDKIFKYIKKMVPD